MLNWCVLVGLNWAKPMMFLLLHVTCSCIFMQTYQFCFYHIDIKLYWFFSACFSLSLSLSLSLSFVSCSMAPKRKSTSSQNPFRSGASSSSSPLANSTPSHIRFRDDKAFKDFLKNFSRRNIHLERQVVLSNFPDTDLPIIIYNRGWESMCGIPITCAFVVIQRILLQHARIQLFCTSFYYSCSR